MRRLARRQRDDEAPPFDLTPMIDVVFLLLIFFMVSTRVFEPFGYTVDLPESEAAPPAEGQSATPVLTVLPDGRAAFNGTELALEDALPKALTEAHGSVTMRADQAARHGDVMRWMDRLHAAGIVSVTLATAPIERASGP